MLEEFKKLRAELIDMLRQLRASSTSRLLAKAWDILLEVVNRLHKEVVK